MRVADTAADLITTIAAAADGRLLVVQESGAVLFLDDDTGWTNLEPLPEPMRLVRDAVFRRNGDLVLATPMGLWMHRTVDLAWQRWHTPSGGGRNRADEILPASDGDVWLGTDGGVEVRHPDGSVSWYDQAVGRDLRIVTGLAEDPEGGIWVSSGAYWEGAFRFYEGGWRFYGSEDGLQSNRIHRIYRDGDGRLWFLGLSKPSGSTRHQSAVITTYHAGRFEVFELEQRLGGQRIHSFAQGSDGALWFSGVRGIGRLLEGEWSYWDTDSGLKSGAVFAIATDPQGGLFFVDQHNGLGRLSPAGEISYLDVGAGLIDNTVWDLEVDARGVLWAATRGGLSSYHDGMWTSFGSDTGLESLSLWPVATTAGRVLVGSAGKGTFLLDLDSAARTNPRVWIWPALVTDDQVVIRWQPLSFRGTMPTERILTRARVDGGEWTAWSVAREMTLTGLSSGEHSFHVQAAGLTGAYDEQGGTVEFRVQPALYGRPVFFLPVGASALAVLLLSVTLVVRRRRDSAALEVSESRYRSFFRQAPISLWEQDYSGMKAHLDGLGIVGEEAMRDYLLKRPAEVLACMRHIRILDTNDASVELFEAHDREDLVAQMPRVFRRDSLAAFADGLATIHGRRPRFSQETVAWSLRGTRRHVILSWAVAPEYLADYSRVLVSVLDVTAQRQAAEEMRAAARTAEEANLAKSVFLANTSHEIRTPINAVMGMAQALLEEDLSPRAADQVNTVLRASESLSEIIDDLLDLSKIEAGQLEVTSLPFDPVEVVEGARATLASKAQDKGIGISVSVDPATPRDVEGDRVRLRQILLNLLGNAVKFTEEGFVDVHLRAENVDDAVALHFEVHDTGIGIPAERLHSIFDPFTQADSSITRTHGGTGLGLSISKRLVEMMGGRIHVHSQPGVGSTFRFDIRVKPGTARQPTETVEAVDIRPMRILLVEDNDLNRKVAQALLRKGDHDITEAENGAVAVDLFRDRPAFDVILMDIQMPVMDGVTATQRIRELEAEAGLPRTPIVALTANAMQGDREDYLRAGMDDFIPKPVRRQKLDAALAQVQARGQPALATLQPEGSTPGDLPVLDPEPLEELRELEALGDFSIAEFLDLFRATAPECLQRARQAHEEGDLETLHREVHTLKGSAREVGARILAARSEFWEKRLSTGDTGDIDGGLDELQGLLEAVCASLEAWESA
jgi:signal transduction histidine kinase/CheY-like chemotaxis protein/HPt (histidine-containing phosphotransfer) domain-containing protein/streptogramin lyase